MGFKKNIIAFFIISIAGVISHFIYEWTGDNVLAGLFFPVNESIWEHLKLIFYPALIYFTAEYFIRGEDIPQNYIPASVKGIFCGMLTIITLYYVLTGVLGRNIDFLNIIIYFISVIAALIKRNRIIRSDKRYSETTTLVFLLITLLFALLFPIWSFYPPHLAIFIPPMIC